MKTKSKRYTEKQEKKIKLQLIAIIESHADWENLGSEEINHEAKTKIKEYSEKLKTMPPEKEYREGYYGIQMHTSYISYMLQIEKALKEEKYQRACHELINITYRQPILQKRIYYNIIKTIENHCNT